MRQIHLIGLAVLFAAKGGISICASEAVAPLAVSTGNVPISTFCRYVPERSDDFAWENDMVAFRAYGPALSRGSENSGIDCWPKRVSYPIIDKWYRLDREQKLSYHQDRGEGSDFYHVGKTRGCGGTAIWITGKMVLPGVYKKWAVVQCEREKSIFTLSYDYTIEGRKLHEEKTITIELGNRLFKSESTFTEDGKPADIDVAIGITTHNQRGMASFNREQGWMAVWEVFDRVGLGTGVVIDPRRILDMKEIKSKAPDESHAILITHTDAAGKVVHYAGYGWGRTGVITTPENWQDYLAQFGTSHITR